MVYMATRKGQFEEFWGTVGTEFAEGDVVQAEVFSARKDVGIGFDAGDQLAENDSVREDVGTLVVPFAP